jgi:hypothetical protein
MSASTSLVSDQKTRSDTYESIPLVENQSADPHLRSNCIKIQYIVITS